MFGVSLVLQDMLYSMQKNGQTNDGFSASGIIRRMMTMMIMNDLYGMINLRTARSCSCSKDIRLVALSSRLPNPGRRKSILYH